MWYIADRAEVILVYVFHSRASVLKSWNTVFQCNSAAFNTNVRVGTEMSSKSCTLVEEDLPSYSIAQGKL